MRSAACAIALDDVGVEPESRAFIPLLRPEVVKLDLGPRRTVSDVATITVAGAVRAYAEASGAEVVAEGIEPPTTSPAPSCWVRPSAKAGWGRGEHPKDPLATEWTVVVLGAHKAAALMARDLGHDGPDSDREFEFVVSYDTTLVTAAAHSIDGRITQPTAGKDIT